MTRRLIIISALVATAVSAPALAFAFGGGGGGCGQLGYGPRGSAMGGRAILTQEALKSTTVTLDQAITKAQDQDNVSGSVVMARLAPFAPAMAQGKRNAFAAPELHPTYMVALFDGDTRTMVTVDGATGESAVVGSATGLMGVMGMGGPGMGGPGSGGFGRANGPADLSKAKVSPSDAVIKAVAATDGGTATMLRGAQWGTDTAWVITVQPTDGTNASSSVVFIDPNSGDVLRVQQMAMNGGGRRPGMGMGMGQGPGMGQGMSQRPCMTQGVGLGPCAGQGWIMGPGQGIGQGPGMGQGQGMGPGQGMGQGQGMGPGQGIGQGQGLRGPITNQ